MDNPFKDLRKEDIIDYKKIADEFEHGPRYGSREYFFKVSEMGQFKIWALKRNIHLFEPKICDIVFTDKLDLVLSDTNKPDYREIERSFENDGYEYKYYYDETIVNFNTFLTAFSYSEILEKHGCVDEEWEELNLDAIIELIKTGKMKITENKTENKIH